jgi:hypothetical protein
MYIPFIFKVLQSLPGRVDEFLLLRYNLLRGSRPTKTMCLVPSAAGRTALMTSRIGFAAKSFPTSLLALIFSLSIFTILFVTPIGPVCAEEKAAETEEKVNELLEQLRQEGKVLEAYRQLYDMGPEADAVLLDMLKGSSLLD